MSLISLISMEIIPAIMPRKYEDIKVRAKDVYGLVKTIQVDIMDGVFVPTKSWPYLEEAEIFQKLVSKEMELFYKSEFKYAADLMIVNSKSKVLNWIDAGFSQIIIHIGSANDINDIIDGCRRSSVEVGIALKTTTPNDAVYPFIEKIDFVQFMGITEIGHQGEPHDTRVIPKIRGLRERYPRTIIQVDGGVNLDTALKLMNAGANRLVVGSALWKSGVGIEATLKSFQHLS